MALSEPDEAKAGHELICYRGMVVEQSQQCVSCVSYVSCVLISRDVSTEMRSWLTWVSRVGMRFSVQRKRKREKREMDF